LIGLFIHFLDAFEKEISSLTVEIESLRSFKEKATEEKEAMLRKEGMRYSGTIGLYNSILMNLTTIAEMEPDADQEELKRLLKQAQIKCDEYRNQLLDFANEANQTQNAQQNQLQGVEAVFFT
jgi:hypothetical protein